MMKRISILAAVFLSSAFMAGCMGSLAGKIEIIPPSGSYITNASNKSSEVLLRNVQVKKSVSDKQYMSIEYPPHMVYVGEPVLVVSGKIQNKHKENDEIDMWADGYDETGKGVAWTLDAAHLPGHIGLHLEPGETGEFTLHLNYSENLSSIRIYANNYSVTPP
jgi:hypothetical protein